MSERSTVEHVVDAESGPERIRRERAWSDARESNPSVRLTLTTDEINGIVERLRSSADYDGGLADEYERDGDYEGTVRRLRADCAVKRLRADHLERAADNAVGRVYRRLLAERQA